MKRTFSLTLASLLLASSAYAQNAPTTLQAVMQVVNGGHPAVSAARYDEQATAEMSPQAKAGSLPTVNGLANVYTGRSETNGVAVGNSATTKEVGVTVEQPLYRGGRTDAEIARAKAMDNDARARLSASEQRALLDATTAYLDVLRDTELYNLATQNLGRLQQEVQATEARLQAGDVTATDLHQAQARVSRAWAEYVAAMGSLNASRARFESTTGITMPGALSYPEPPANLPSSLSQAAMDGDTISPDVQQAIAMHEASRHNIDVAKSDLRPQVTLFASYDYQRDPQPGILDKAEEKLLGVRARMPFYEGGLLRSKVRQAGYIANRDEARIKDVRRVVQENITQSWAQMIAAKAEYTARVGEADITRTASDGVREEARLGERTVLDILDAEQEVLEAQAALVRARHDFVLSSYTLAYNLGKLGPDSAR